MRLLQSALVVVMLLPAANARAGPISVDLASSGGGFAAGPADDGWFSIDLGAVAMPSALSTGSFLVNGLTAGADYTVTFMLEGVAAVERVRLEILDRIDGDDRWDPADQPAGLPDGYSTSNNLDGFSFAQNGGVARGAIFAGGSAGVTADENTHRGDILLFDGLMGAENAAFTFGLRDRIGGRSFLLRLSAESDVDALPTPEPASMLLIGTGLAGLAALRRRRQTHRPADA